ncbi:hypothetical protein [Streptomyces olivaceiscleroticus]|uniref:Uncharacterized protein n=1 Tax=Streptomyces olivaceiscleroticus TaxID=68245 RepID=A0ABN1BMI1_9ACTN
MTVTTLHPLLAQIPADQLTGALTQVIEVGTGLITVVTDGRWDAYEVTSWRPLTDNELALDRQEFPGVEGLPTVAYVTAATFPEIDQLDAAIARATYELTVRLARDANETDEALAA